jgi:hypothetical protein
MFRNRAHALVHLVHLTVLSLSACVGELDDANETATDTDIPDECFYTEACNGVQVFCQNEGNDPNYWWVPWSDCRHLGIISDEGCGPNDEHCCLDDDLEPESCFCKQYALPAAGFDDAGGEMGILCVGQDFPAMVDPLEDWATGEYPTIEDEILSWCSDKCVTLSNVFGNHPNEPDPQCNDADWSGHNTRSAWDPSKGYNCPVTMELNLDDPDGSEVPWELVGGPSSPMPASCDLNGDCVDWFYPSVATYFHPELGKAGSVEPETRGAHYLGVDVGTSQLAIDMPGSGAGVDDTEDVFGQAEYTALECGDNVCPFLLASLDAYNTTDTWMITVETSTGAQQRAFSNLQVDLAQSTLGLRLMSLDKVAFAPGALRLFVEFSVAGGSEGGNHGYFVENTDYVFADYDDGSLGLELSFPIQSGGGEATLTVDLDPDEHPPAAGHDLDASEPCDASTGLDLDPHLTASDPDNDIDIVIWWVDGEPCSDTKDDCGVPLGTHDVVLEVHDERDARVVAETHEVTVTTGPNCSA